MKAAEFKIETFPGKKFSGFSNSENRNGWAYPYFAFGEAQYIAELQNELPGNSARYDKERDSFIFKYDDEIEEYAAEEHNGFALYAIGGGSWIWEENDVQ